MDVRAPMTLLATGRCGRVVRAHDQPAGRDRRRHRDRDRRRSPGCPNGVRPVSPHRPGHRRTSLSDLRGGARRRRATWSTRTAGRFMLRVHPDAELAPRDVVASAIHARTQNRSDHLSDASAPRSRPRALPFPQSGGRLPRSRARPYRRSDSGRPSRALPHGRASPPTSRAAAARGAVRQRRVRHAPAHMAPTGWPRTRCSNALCSRTAASMPGSSSGPSGSTPTPPGGPTCALRWTSCGVGCGSGAGPTRTAAGLERPSRLARIPAALKPGLGVDPDRSRGPCSSRQRRFAYPQRRGGRVQYAPDHALIAAGLAEDVGTGDITTDAIVPADAPGDGRHRAARTGVVCGLEFAIRSIPRRSILRSRWTGSRRRRPDPADAPTVVATLRASARAILTGERLALNLMQRASGIATATRRYADAIGGTARRAARHP